MSDVQAGIASVWLIGVIVAGVFCGMLASDIFRKRLSVAAHIAAGIGAAVLWPGVLLVVLTKGFREIFEVVFPGRYKAGSSETVGDLPEARTVTRDYKEHP